jgi:hypothetical protein
MENKFKYARTPIGTRRSVHLRRFKDPVIHEKYYAFIKHRCQARFRQERHRLSWSQWQLLWPAELWSRRGRGPRNLRLRQINPKLGWSLKNCAVVEHGTHMSEINLARTEANKLNAGSI